MIISKTNTAKRGFTIVELTLAIAFLSILLMATLILAINAGKIYLKGVTNKTINQSGRDIQDSLRRDFLASSAVDIATVSSGGTLQRICLGSVSYVWNLAPTFYGSPTSQVQRYADNNHPVGLARVSDVNKNLCKGGFSGHLTSFTDSQVNDLISGDGKDLALHSFSVDRVVSNDQKGLYRISYTIGTNETGTLEGSGASVSCKVGSAVANLSNFNFCSIKQFDMIVRVGGGQ